LEGLRKIFEKYFELKPIEGESKVMSFEGGGSDVALL